MALGRYREAAEAAGRDGDELLRHLDRGLTLFYAGDPRASNLYFARAEQLVEERYTRSIGKAALSLLLNDTVLPYQPDPYERLLVPLYRALNHVAAGEPTDAAVEARRMAALVLARRDRDAGRAAREGDAFLCVLAGVLSEWAGRPEDTEVSYRLAAEIDPTGAEAWLGPATPGGAAVLAAEAGTWSSDAARSEEAGELVFIVEGGFVAPPVEERLFLWLDDADLAWGRRDPRALGEDLAKRHMLRLSGTDPDAGRTPAYLLPVVLPRRPLPPALPAAVRAQAGGASIDLLVAFDVSRAAALTWEAELPALLAKTFARTVTKTLAFKETTDDADVLVRVLANALHAASERADTRAWLSLPGEIRFGRLRLPAGEHDVRLSFDGAAGPRTLDFPAVRIWPGRPTIVTARFY